MAVPLVGVADPGFSLNIWPNDGSRFGRDAYTTVSDSAAASCTVVNKAERVDSCLCCCSSVDLITLHSTASAGVIKEVLGQTLAY